MDTYFRFYSTFEIACRNFRYRILIILFLSLPFKNIKKKARKMQEKPPYVFPRYLSFSLTYACAGCGMAFCLLGGTGGAEGRPVRVREELLLLEEFVEETMRR